MIAVTSHPRTLKPYREIGDRQMEFMASEDDSVDMDNLAKVEDSTDIEADADEEPDSDLDDDDDIDEVEGEESDE
jgi:hypothetical protein